MIRINGKQDSSISVRDFNGETLKQFRESIGLTQSEFASKIGLSREFLGQIERGQREISKTTYLLLENYFSKEIKPDGENRLADEINTSYENEEDALLDDISEDINQDGLARYPRAIEMFNEAYKGQSMADVFPFLANFIYRHASPKRLSVRERTLLAIDLLIEAQNLTSYMRKIRSANFSSMSEESREKYLITLRNKISLIAYELNALTQKVFKTPDDFKIETIGNTAIKYNTGVFFADDDVEEVIDSYQGTIDELSDDILFYVGQVYNLKKENKKLQEELKSIKQGTLPTNAGTDT